MIINIKTLKYLLLSMAFVLMAGRAQAQIAKMETGKHYLSFIPKSLSYDGQARLVTTNLEGSGASQKLTFTVFNPDFEQEKVISYNARITSTGSDGTSFEELDYNLTDAVAALRVFNLEEDGYYDSEDLYITQTLFNNDEKYEYVRTLRKESVGENGETVYKDCGFEVVQDDGTVVLTFDVGETDLYWWLDVVLMNGQTYLLLQANDDAQRDTYLVHIYKLDKSSNSVKKAKTVDGIRISPRLVSKSQPVNIAFKQAASAGTSVVVTSLDGKVVARRTVNAGDTSIDISTTRMATGLYNFTVFAKGKVVENGKVIVK